MSGPALKSFVASAEEEAIGSCYACGGAQWKSLPIIGDQALISDGQTIKKPLRKITCMQCGLARSGSMPDIGELAELFSNNYELYAHPIGETFESERQKQYADWIAEILGDLPLEGIFEIGSGNGSLLHSLKRHFPYSALSGIEPSAAAVQFARDAGLNVQQGLFDERSASSVTMKFILSVNVIEHVNDPLTFLRATRASLSSDGAGLFICPDGDHASSEILIYDHLHSFSRRSIYELFPRAGLHVHQIHDAPASLGAFMGIFFTVSPASSPCEVTFEIERPDALHDRRHEYLSSWKQLDAKLLQRTRPYHALTCFGIGEAAHLLATYAPQAWDKVVSCTADTFIIKQFRGKHILPYNQNLDSTDAAMLLGVRPGSQDFLARRLMQDGYNVIRWNDVVTA